MEPMSDLRIEKARAEAVLTLTDGSVVHGFVFVSAFSAKHSGPETVKDVLDGEPGFVPFDAIEPQGTRTRLFNHDHIALVVLQGSDELRRDPGWEVASKRHVVMRLSNGLQVSGQMSVAAPRGRGRLSDRARSAEPFWYVATEDTTLIVNVRHVVEMTELADTP
jgi:hypothetical protein